MIRLIDEEAGKEGTNTDIRKKSTLTLIGVVIAIVFVVWLVA